MHYQHDAHDLYHMHHLHTCIYALASRLQKDELCAASELRQCIKSVGPDSKMLNDDDDHHELSNCSF